MSNTFALMFSGTLVIDQPAVVAAAVATATSPAHTPRLRQQAVRHAAPHVQVPNSSADNRADEQEAQQLGEQGGLGRRLLLQGAAGLRPLRLAGRGLVLAVLSLGRRGVRLVDVAATVLAAAACLKGGVLANPKIGAFFFLDAC